MPQLLLPAGADQFANAEAVRGCAAGDRLLTGEVGVAAIRSAARARLGATRPREAAGRIAAEIAAMPAPCASGADAGRVLRAAPVHHRVVLLLLTRAARRFAAS